MKFHNDNFHKETSSQISQQLSLLCVSNHSVFEVAKLTGGNLFSNIGCSCSSDWASCVKHGLHNRGVSSSWAGWAIAHPDFGRIEGATGQWRRAALLLAHPAFGSQLLTPVID